MTTVNTANSHNAVMYGYMRTQFYTEGLFWAFYVNGGNAGWETSADGIDWSGSFTVIALCGAGYDFSIWFDEATGFVHYTRTRTLDVYYGRGTPLSNGTINWSAEQMAYEGAFDDEYYYPCISVDTNGYAWIGALNRNGTIRAHVLKNANNDGTWAQDFIYELSTVDDTQWNICPIPLTDGKVYVIYCRDTQLPLGQLWDGDWDAGEENDLADFNIENGFQFSAVAIGDNIHFVYNRDSTNQIRHNERVWGVGWDVADVLVQDTTTSTCGPVLSIDTSTDDLYCFWTSTVADHAYYKQYTGAAWDSIVDWIDEEADDIQYDYTISSSYMDYDGVIGLMYVTKLGSPYNVKFDYLGEGPSSITYRHSYKVTIG